MTTVIRSYFRDGKRLVPIDEHHGRLSDERYVRGAIELTVDGTPLMTQAEWDLVDQLWSYLITLAQKVGAGEPASTSFPDQPIDLLFAPNSRGTRVEMRLRYSGVDRRVSADRDELLMAIVEAGSAFFEALLRAAPGSAHHWRGELARLETLRSRVRD